MTAFLGPHAIFIVLSYAVAALIVAGLVVWVVGDHRRLVRRLADLERRGYRRRSSPPAAVAWPSAAHEAPPRDEFEALPK